MFEPKIKNTLSKGYLKIPKNYAGHSFETTEDLSVRCILCNNLFSLIVLVDDTIIPPCKSFGPREEEEV